MFLIIFLLLIGSIGFYIYSSKKVVSRPCPENSNDNYTFNSTAVLGSKLITMLKSMIKTTQQYIHKLI